MSSGPDTSKEARVPRTVGSQGRSSLIRRVRGRRPVAARKKACALAAHNRHFEAIAFLSAANRSSLDAETEALLVRLRHQAFAQVPRSVPTATWPPELADPFPGVIGQPPEIELSQLTADLLGGALLHHGCLLVRGHRSELPSSSREQSRICGRDASMVRPLRSGAGLPHPE